MRRLGPAGPVERQLGWVVSLIGVVQLVLYTVPAFRASSGHPQWWNFTGIVLAGLTVLLAVLGRVLPLRLLPRLWLAIPLALGVLAATAFSPSWGAPGDLSPWPWTMDWTAYAYLALAVQRPALAFLGPLVIGMLPGASALLFLGEIPHDLAVQIPLRVSGIGFTVLFLALRLRLRALHDSERRAREAEEGRVRSLAEAERRQRLALLVHDNVLSVLNAARSPRTIFRKLALTSPSTFVACALANPSKTSPLPSASWSQSSSSPQPATTTFPPSAIGRRLNASQHFPRCALVNCLRWSSVRG
ncbi:MAG TPA: hypothetical protein PKA37_03345 [Planctomycetota bacterium]|nr:hypothetical protein [Planctomycetota bacterium]